MAEEKTLKDFERVIEISKPEKMKIKVIDAGIKAEAVKWVHEYRCDRKDDDPIERERVADSFIKFFNITEEELL